MDDSHDPNRDDDLFADANRWFFRLQADDVTPDEKQQFAAWLNNDPMNALAWREVHILMQALRVPAKASYQTQYASNRPYKKSPTRLKPRLRLMPALFTSSLLLIVGYITYLQLPVFLDRWSADYMTVAGERRTLTLADGTLVDLDTDTAIKMNITTDKRRVTVLRGKAFFEIANDPRPFVVNTQQGDARDIGTAFSVERHEDMSTVTVAAGIVDVNTKARPDTPARVVAGQALDYSALNLSPVRSADLDQDLAWRQGQLIFRQERLADVVTKLNRYRTGRIVIVNPWIGDQLVSGAFDITRPDAPIRALEEVLGVKTTTISSYLVTLY